MSHDITFESLISQKVWEDYPEYVSESQKALEKDVVNDVKAENKFISDLKNSEIFSRFKVKTLDPKLLETAKNLLKSGQVVGVDGTRSDYPMFSGTRCQIGVVAVNYTGEKIQKSFFISEAKFFEESQDVVENIKNRITNSDQLSNFALGGLMFYRERELGLNPKFVGKYKMFHGPLFPFELMTDLGRLKALRINLKLLERIMDEGKSFSVISDSSQKSFYYFGLALEEGQYFSPDLTFGQYLLNDTRFLTWSQKWELNDRKLVEEFIQNYAEKVKIGVIRIGKRPYVFHAPEEIFDIAAHILAVDSSFQHERGFPLLIDYADTLCSEYFSSGQFKRRMEWELAKTGAFFTEVSERRTRNKG